MSTAKLSRAEADKIETRVHRLQLLVVVFWVVEVLGLFLVYVTAILGVAEHKAALSISEFLTKHPYLLPCLGVVSATAVILYYINILLLHPFEERLLVAGIVGFAAFLYSEFSDSITKTTADGVADTFQKVVVAEIITLVFYKLYCDGMRAIAAKVSKKAARAWREQWVVTVFLSIMVFAAMCVLVIAFKRPEKPTANQFVSSMDLLKNPGAYQAAHDKYNDAVEEYQKEIKVYVVIVLIAFTLTIALDIIVKALEFVSLSKTRERLLTYEEDDREEPFFTAPDDDDGDDEFDEDGFDIDDDEYHEK